MRNNTPTLYLDRTPHRNYSHHGFSLGLMFRFLFALVLLNVLLSFGALWPTVIPVPDTRLSPDFVFLLAFLTLWVAWQGRPSGRFISVLSGVFALMMLGHYANVAMPNLLGRPINLYWDVPQLPRFVWVTAQGLPWWLSVAAILGVVLSACLLHVGLRWAFKMLFGGLVPIAKRKVWYLVLLVPFVFSVASHQGVQVRDPVLVMLFSDYMSKPIAPAYWAEAQKLADILIPSRAARLLPSATVVDDALAMPVGKALAALRGRDVSLMYLETYGAILYDQPQARVATSGSFHALEKAIESSGRHVVSAFFTSPTFGGASDLAHLSVLSGIDLKDSRKHDVLLTTDRPTLSNVFKREGYQVFGLYHSVAWEWPERAFYDFDVYLSGPDLGYSGPAFGFWKVPDQFAAARVEQMYPRTADAPPRFMVFPTISSHFPFHQVPPYQADWKRVLGPNPFNKEEAKRAQAEPVNWNNMRPDYFRAINYVNTWLAGYFAQPEPRERVYVMVGDHQPTGSVVREEAPWDVPVYVVSSDLELLERFKLQGFSEGLTPTRRESLGGLHQLTGLMLKIFAEVVPPPADYSTKDE